MSSTEPPSRNAPRNQAQDTKAARDELSSKGKVEKVREIDADEQARKQRFQRFYKDDAAEDERVEEENRPSPFDLLSGKPTPKTESEGPLGSSFKDVQDTIIPAPPYSPPPSVDSFEGEEEDNGEQAASEGALPQSDDFWEDMDMPDQPSQPSNFEETTHLTRNAGFEEPPQRAKKGAADKGRSAQGGPFAKEGKGIPLPPHGKEGKKMEASPFGPPGKPIAEKRSPEEIRIAKRKAEFKEKEIGKAKAPSPFEQPSKKEEPPLKSRPFEKEEERYAGPLRGAAKPEKKEFKYKTEQEGSGSSEASALPLKPDERESGGGGSKHDQNKDKKTVEIDSPSLPRLPAHVQPMAMNATTQAAPYLNPSTMNLFFQMVGTMYMMAGPQGINRTEIVLNNPSFASSKFFGATITIEKYASAPDSFNIRLTGSQEAVVSFRENIPSLMSAFENGSFAFRVNRLDVEYSTEKPIFHRKEKGGDKGEAGGGDLGERRK